MSIKFYKKLAFFIAGLFFTVSLSAQPLAENAPSTSAGGTISGRVFSKSQKVPMEYASIALYRLPDSTMVTGSITDKEGHYKFTGLKNGKYYMLVTFMGFDVHKVKDIVIESGKSDVKLPIVYLQPNSNTLKAVDIKAQQSMVSYQMDKKVIDVTQDMMASAGNAIDVLQNVPSVSVDLEGNVSIRGSTNFTVLIDGRPSILDGNDALQQIPASSIQKVEIITNPSAKYSPEGVGGIINIILKKEKRNGLNGVASGSLANPNTYQGNILLAYRKGKLNYNLSVDGMNRDFGMNVNTQYNTLGADTTNFRYSTIDGHRIRKGYGVKGGIDYYINDNSTLSLQGRIGNYGFNSDNMSRQHNFTYPATVDSYFNSTSNSDRWGNFYSLQGDFQHKFNDLGQKIEALVFYSKRTSDDKEGQTDYPTNADWVQTGGVSDRIQSSTLDTTTEFRVQLDYTLPIGEKGNLEAGLQSRINRDAGNYDLQNFDTATSQWVYNQNRSSIISFDRNIYAGYVSYKNMLGKFGYELGFRGEYTYRSVNDSTGTSTFTINRFDLFPSLYLSYQFKYNYQVYASYSKRIQRPRGWDLNPFPRVIDQYNVRVGNPELEPEYIDSYELGVQKVFSKAFVSMEGYYRKGRNNITRIVELGPDGILYRTSTNLDSDRSMGVELMVNSKMNKWLNLNLTGNVYHYSLQGSVSGDSVTSQSTNWSLRGTISANLSKTFKIQWQGMYNSPTATVQGSRKGFFFNSLALRKDFIDNKLNVTLSARDIFGTAKFDFISTGTGFYTHTVMQRQWPIISLNVNYIINNYKQKRQKQQNDSNQENSEDMGF
ncbi:MAG: TonB-dependent receptor [Bacteroidales bacterium]|nr:TonB-dependent receptor [Bacteroidales bacterium]